MIYFVRCIASCRVKIGFSENPYVRFSKIQSDCPTELELTCVIDGAQAGEAELHKRFSHLRVRGEWFADDGSISAEFNAQTSLPRPASRPPFGPNQFAAIMGISQSQASRLLSGKRPPTLEMAVRAYRLCGLKLGAFGELRDEQIGGPKGNLVAFNQSAGRAA